MTGHILPESTNACSTSPTTDIQAELLPVIQADAALHDAFTLLDGLAGEGIGYTPESGKSLDCDDVVVALCDAAGVVFDEGWIELAVVALSPGFRERGAPCETCGKPIEVGQVVLCYDDAGEMHADCERPFALEYTREDGEPDPVVLLGSPMRHVALSRLTSTTPTLGDMVMVPREPTEAMWDAANEHGGIPRPARVWSAMLSAAPASTIPTSVANEERAAIIERWRDLADFARSAKGDHSKSVHPNTVARELDKAANLFAALSPALDNTAVEGQSGYIERRLKEGGLRLVSGSPTMLSDEFARYEANRVAAEVASVLPTLWRNIEAGDSRMARENVACLGFLLREGRLPSWEELQGAFDAMRAAETEKAR